MRLIRVSILLLSVLLIVNIGSGSLAGKITVTDLAGRRVEVPIPARRIVAIGPGALRLVCYVNGVNRVVGIENIDREGSPGGKTYLIAYPELKKLPVIGQGGAFSSPDPEKIVNVKPDVIFACSFIDRKGAEDLQLKTGIPVVMLDYGISTIINESLYKSLRLTGMIIGEEKRAGDIVNYIKKTQRELDLRTERIANERKPGVYVGALGMRGGHGIESTQAKYPPFVMVNARNVADETGREGSIMIEKEKLLIWDPDIIFIDLGNYNLVKQDYHKNPQFYQALKAVKNGNVYGQLPFNFYNTNIDTAIVDAYWAGKVIFPEQFRDIDPVKKANEIYRFFLGKSLYEELTRTYGSLTGINIGE